MAWLLAQLVAVQFGSVQFVSAEACNGWYGQVQPSSGITTQIFAFFPAETKFR